MKELALNANDDDFNQLAKSNITDYCYKLFISKPNNVSLVKGLLNYLDVITESSLEVCNILNSKDEFLLILKNLLLSKEK